MYGYRARIGYTSPPVATEVFPYEFYRVVPKGVTLVITTLAIMQMDKEEIDRSYEISLQAARALAKAGVDIVVLGGVPINLSRGFDGVDRVTADLEEELKVPVTTSISAQVDALRTVGARRVAVGHPFGEEFSGIFGGYCDHYGFTRAGSKGANMGAIDLGSIPSTTAFELGRKLKKAHPEADTLWLPCPHWAVADSIEPLEYDLKINVITAQQAIVWQALRRCGVTEPIDGFGRLFRDH